MRWISKIDWTRTARIDPLSCGIVDEMIVTQMDGKSKRTMPKTTPMRHQSSYLPPKSHMIPTKPPRRSKDDGYEYGYF